MTIKPKIIWFDRWGNQWPSKDEYLEYVENNPDYEKKAAIDERTDSKPSEPDARLIEKNQKKQKKSPFINCFGIEIK